MKEKLMKSTSVQVQNELVQKLKTKCLVKAIKQRCEKLLEQNYPFQIPEKIISDDILNYILKYNNPLNINCFSQEGIMFLVKFYHDYPCLIETLKHPTIQLRFLFNNALNSETHEHDYDIHEKRVKTISAILDKLFKVLIEYKLCESNCLPLDVKILRNFYDKFVQNEKKIYFANLCEIEIFCRLGEYFGTKFLSNFFLSKIAFKI